MELLYKENLPFEYKRLRKTNNNKSQLSNELKNRFNCCYKEIAGLDKEFEDIESKLKDDFLALKSHVKLELESKGIKKSIYVDDYAEFLFGICYLLIEKYNLTQEKAADLIGMKSNQFSKLDIYPRRCYDAFTKKDKKSLIPYNEDSEGIRIAEFINQHIQAPYACYGFVGISNDLDVFTNLSCTDKKAYILTCPALNFELDYSDEEIYAIMKKRTYCEARFLFATANNFNNKPGTYIGRIKSEIIELLEMKTKEILHHSTRIKKMLEEGDEYKKYVYYEKAEFDRLLGYYRAQNIVKEEIENYHVVNMYAYDTPDEWADMGLDYDTIEAALEQNKDEEALKQIENSIEILYNDLVNMMSYYDRDAQFDEDAFKDWLETLKTLFKGKFILELLEKQNDEQENDKKIRRAAVYWILHVFSNFDGSEEYYNNVLKYLKTEELNTYVDSLNKEIQQPGKETHLYYKDDNFDIYRNLKELLENFGKSERALLVYIDAEAYNINKKINDIIKDFNVILIVKDKSGVVQDYGLCQLDSGLSLYAGGIING